MTNHIDTIGKLDPVAVFTAFAELSAIPRCSKCEDQVISWLIGEAKKLGLSYEQDAIGNLLLKVPASKGYESFQGMIIQGHVDMVCEKDRDSLHDFASQGLDLYLDGSLLKARGTSLGADNGIAVAMMLAVARGACEHGPIDLLFTIDEETGLTGAINLDPALLRYDLLLNIDSEEEEILYIGCAGGVETEGEIPLARIAPESGSLRFRVTLEGLTGGHSGTDINNFRANALIELGRILFVEARSLNVQVGEIHGGDKHNVIPREAWADIYVPEAKVEDLKTRLAWWQDTLQAEWGDKEPGLKVLIEALKGSGQVLTGESQGRALSFMRTIPHGVIAMSRHIEGLVATSTNFASFDIAAAGHGRVLTSQRSDAWSAIHDAADRVAASIALAGGSSRETREYPSWTPDTESPLLELGKKVYREVYKREPIIKSIHAGLETGVIGAKRKGIKMLSCGPDIRGAHSPQERLDVTSTARVWNYVTVLLKSLNRL